MTKIFRLSEQHDVNDLGYDIHVGCYSCKKDALRAAINRMIDLITDEFPNLWDSTSNDHSEFRIALEHKEYEIALEIWNDCGDIFPFCLEISEEDLIEEVSEPRI